MIYNKFINIIYYFKEKYLLKYGFNLQMIKFIRIKLIIIVKVLLFLLLSFGLKY